jgi:hypothetical protein
LFFDFLMRARPPLRALSSSPVSPERHAAVNLASRAGLDSFLLIPFLRPEKLAI